MKFGNAVLVTMNVVSKLISFNNLMLDFYKENAYYLVRSKSDIQACLILGLGFNSVAEQQKRVSEP